MWQGYVIAIGITKAGGERISPVDHVNAVAGKGLEGDRYFEGEGSFSGNTASGRQITLIEAEAVEALERDYGYKLEFIDSRRNIVTRGVPLNHLVGKEFRVGEAVLRGVRLSEPCNHLAGLTSERVKAGLVHRGGLRADIVTGGEIRVGDEIAEP